MQPQDWINIALLTGLVWNFFMHLQAGKMFSILQKWQQSEDAAIIKLFGYVGDLHRDRIADNNAQIKWNETKMAFLKSIEGLEDQKK